MRLLSRLLWVFALAVVPLAACAEVTGECVGTAPLALTVTGVDVEWVAAPLEGVQLCETDTTNCVLTDAKGRATLCLPFDVETSYTLTREGYGSYIVADIIGADGEPNSIGMRSVEHLAQQYDRVMSDYPMRAGTGRILLEVSPRFEGATFELRGATGEAYYYDEEGTWNLDLTETTCWGWGGFVDVSPGKFQVIYGGSVQRCVPFVGWPGNEENSVWFPVQEGYTTTVDMSCPPPPDTTCPPRH